VRGGCPGSIGHRSYDIDVTAGSFGPSDESPAATDRVDLDPHSAIPLAVAFSILAISVWLVRSIPRTLAATAIAGLIAMALNPLVDALRRGTGWKRRHAAATVLTTVGVILIAGITLVTVPTINQVRDFNKEIPKTVKQLGDLPIVGPRLRAANASKKVEDWLHGLPKRLSVNTSPIAHAASTVAAGIAAGLLTLLLTITLVLDGEFLVGSLRRALPPSRRTDADRFGRLVYNVVGRYIAGTLLMAALAGVVTLTTSLGLGVPLAPLLAIWVAICNPIPQIGGFLGAVPFVALGLTRSALTGVICLVVFLIYQQTENHLLQPMIIGRAVRLTPPATMVAALVGVAAGGLIGGLLAIPMLGASKAIYLALREPALDIPPPSWVPPSELLPP
jgi:predicted PurR-regulated permease PerM